jgi:hypothetical protein
MECYILDANNNGFTFDNFNEAMRFCIFHSEFIQIRVNYKDKSKPVEFWHRKTPQMVWSPRCESAIESLVADYSQNRLKCSYWICRNMGDERLNDLTMRLHFIRDIKYDEYLDTHFTINIVKIMSEDEIIKSLATSDKMKNKIKK